MTLVPTRPRICADCKGVTTDLVAPGKHGARWLDGVLVNCARQPIR